MIPILYSANEKDFNTNGIGMLPDVGSINVEQELNGMYELTLSYPGIGIHAQEIMDRSIIMAKPDPVTDPQPFRIYRVNPVSTGTITAYARHLAYDMSGIVAAPFTASSAIGAIASLQAAATTPCPFTFSTDKSTVAKMNYPKPRSLWMTLGGSEGSILDVYGGEYEFDRYKVTLHNHRGTDRGVTIRYGKNLRTLEMDRNCAEVYTGVYPYWYNEESGLVELPDRVLKSDGTYSFERIYDLDLSSEWQDPPTAEQLEIRARKWMKDNDIGIPKVSWKIEFVQLEQTEEYKGKALLERVLLGDTVHVIFPDMGVDVSARVVQIDYDPVNERYNSVTLGRIRQNLADTIIHQKQQIDKAPTSTDLERAKAAATAWLTNGKGYKVERRDANGNTVDTLYLDKPDINQAINVLRVGQSGIGFSHTGVNGPYISAWTIDGHFNADFITAGTLNASMIKSGTLRAALVKLLGAFEVYDNDVKRGHIGYMQGSTGEAVTHGVGINNAASDCYVLITDAGISLRAGDREFYIVKNGEGAAKFNCNIVVNADAVINGKVKAREFIQMNKTNDQIGEEVTV